MKRIFTSFDTNISDHQNDILMGYDFMWQRSPDFSATGFLVPSMISTGQYGFEFSLSALDTKFTSAEEGPLFAVIDGDAGNNTLDGTAGDDTLNGFAGDDILNGLAGNDILNGGDGIDYAVFSGTSIGDYTIADLGSGTFTVTDNVGTDGADTLNDVEFVRINGVDTYLGTPPAVAAPVVVSISDDTGSDGADGVTNDSTLSIIGTSEADATVEVFIDGGSIGTTTADGSGNWTFDNSGTALEDADYVITATATDFIGTTSSASADYDLTVDTIAPMGALIAFDPIGVETQVNTYTSDIQNVSTIAGLTGGDYVITWQSQNQDGSGYGVYAQRYDILGATLGGETLINTTTSGSQETPQITSLSDGGYVITWQSANQDGSGTGIYAQRYDSSGVVVGVETLINTTTADNQIRPFITSLSDGGYVIAWHSDNQDGDGDGVYLQRYDNTSMAVGTETLVNSTTTNDQGYVAVTGLSDGGYLVTWASFAQDSDSWGIYSQRYDNLDATVGGETLVNTTVSDSQFLPIVTSLVDGSYVIVWQSNGQDGSNAGVYAQRYDAAGMTVGTETQINTFTTDIQGYPKITSLSDGGYVIVWQSKTQDGDGYGVYAQRFDSAGVTVGSEAHISTTTIGWQDLGTVAELANGNIVVTWTDQDGEGSVRDIFSQMLDMDETVDVVAIDAIADDVNALASISGTTSDDGADVLVIVTIGGTDYIGTVTPAAGIWSIDPTTLMDGGTGLAFVDGSSYSVSAAPVDLAGNIGNAGAESFTFDTTAPNAPVIVSISDDSGASAGDDITNDNTLSFTGTAEVGASVEVFIGGISVGTTIADGSGDWTFDHSGTTLMDADYTLTAQATDAAGNTGAISANYDLTVDTIAPAELVGFAAMGGETLVNTYTTNNQFFPSITSLVDGGYIVAWHSIGQDGDEHGIYTQRYDSDGVEIGTDVLVNTVTASYQTFPAIAALADGGYVVAWQSNAQDGSSYGVYSQRYDSAGVGVGLETLVNTTTSSEQSRPSITALDDGGYLVTWQSLNQDGSGLGVYSQRYDNTSALVGTETRVNTVTSDNQYSSVATSLSDGGYVIVWQSANQGGSFNDVYTQRYDSSGVSVGSETLVNTVTVADQRDAAVTSLTDGGYIIVWHALNQDGSGMGVYAQRYDSANTSVGGETLINTTTAGDQLHASVTSLSDGGYVVTWFSANQDGDGDGIYAQRYDRDGVTNGPETQINTTTSGDQRYPVLTELNNGNLVISWTDEAGADGDGYGVYSQMFDMGDFIGIDAIADAVNAISALSGTTNTELDILITVTVDGTDYTATITPVAGEWTVDLATLMDDVTALVLEEGASYAVSAVLVDVAGNIGDAATENFIFDTLLPGAAPTLFEAVGEETQVNTYEAGNQQYAHVSSLVGGDYVVAWTSNGQDGSDDGVYAQRYEADGTPVGGEFHVATTSSSFQILPEVSGLTDGGFVITWWGNGPGDSTGIFAQRYDAAGASIGGETLINTTISNGQYTPTVVGLDDGGYVIAWHDLHSGSNRDVYLQRYDAAGSKVGGEIFVPPNGTASQDSATLTALSDGGFIIGWNGQGAGDSAGIFTQRYDVTGATVGGETLINTTTAGTQNRPSIDTLSDGGYVVTWQSDAQDGDNYGIFAQRFDVDGVAVGLEVQLNTTTTGEQGRPEIVALSDGGYVVVWQSDAQDGDGYGIYAQRFGATGVEISGEVLVNTTTTGAQSFPDITELSNGNIVISWVSDGQDSSGLGVYMQTFSMGRITTITAIDNDSGASDSDGFTNDNMLVITGTAEGGASVEVFVNAISVGITLADAGGNWTFDYSGTPLADGDHTITAQATDAAENVGAMSADYDVEIDTLAPTFTALSNDNVDEIATNGTVVGIVSANDTGGNALVFTLINDASGRFAIDSATGEITVLYGLALDYEQATSHDVQVQISDGVNTTTQTLTINLTDVSPETAIGDGADNRFDGDIGNDVFNGGDGADVLNGAGGDDTLNGDAGADTLVGGAGADALNGGADFDTVDYRGANEAVALNLNTGGTLGEADGDTFSGIERLYATNFNDTVTGTDSNEFFYGEDGNDTINGGGGIDRIYGGDGNDIQRGDAGNDVLYGSDGVDQLNGGTGFDIARYSDATGAVIVDMAGGGTGGDANGDTYFGIEAVYGSDFGDTLTGNSSVNELRGEMGDDSLDGAGGNDRLYGGEGADTLNGGAGIDTAYYTAATSGVTLDMASGGTGGEANGDSFTSIEWVRGSDFADNITGDALANSLFGNDGNDTLNGADGNDRLYGGEGNDTINGGNGIDFIYGQNGNDILNGNAGNDFFYGSAGGDSFDGGDDFDTVSYLPSSSGVTVNMQTGGTGGDAAGDTYANIERIFASSHNDVLYGSNGDDLILGNGGNDLIGGGQGNDRLFGGAGDDQFIYDTTNGGADLIYNFRAGTLGDEIIHIQGGDTDFDTFAEVMAVATQVGANVVIDFGSGNRITLIALDIVRLEAADFDFNVVLNEEPAEEKTSITQMLGLPPTKQDTLVNALAEPELFEDAQDDVADMVMLDVDMDMGLI